MKKTIIITTVALILNVMTVLYANATGSYAEGIPGLDVTQIEKIKRIEFAYEQQYNSLERSIINYGQKAENVENDTDKSPEQKMYLKNAYKRNIEILKAQQKQAEETADNALKTVLTEEQFNMYKLNKNTKKIDNLQIAE